MYNVHVSDFRHEIPDLDLEEISSELKYWSGNDMETLNRKILQSRWELLDTATHFKKVNHHQIK